MDTTLACALLGAAGGYLIDNQRGEASLADGYPMTLRAFTTGAATGALADTLLATRNFTKLQDILKQSRKATPADVKKLQEAAKSEDTAVFLQGSSGDDLGNAFYTYSEKLPGVDTGTIYKRIGLAAANSKMQSAAKKAGDPDTVVVGRGMDRLPVLAHELGHAADFKRNPPGFLERNAGRVANALMAVNLGLGAAMWLDKDRTRRKMYHTGLLGSLPLALLSRSVTRHYYNKREIQASKNAIKYINKIYPEDVDKAAGALETAYSTYEPVRLTPLKLNS